MSLEVLYLTKEGIYLGSSLMKKKTSVLGTFMNAGQFQGNGEKYLGIRFPENNNFKYGWIKIFVGFSYFNFADKQRFCVLIFEMPVFPGITAI